jgi:predicted dehydrogenase
MASKTVRVGLVGCGGIARAHVDAYRAAGGNRIVAVYDVVATAAAGMAKDTGARAAASIAEMIGKDRPDAVSVCTPPAVHLANCRPFLRAGVAVLCEKPLEATERAAAALRNEARAARVPFQIAYCHRFHGPIMKLRKLIRRGVLGEPLLFRNIFAGYLDLKGNHRVHRKLSGGGVIIDNGSHATDLYRFLVGEPARVHAITGTAMQKYPIEDFALMHLKGPGRACGEITLSWSLKVSGNWVEWYGTKGTAYVSYWNEGAPDLAYQVDGGDRTVVKVPDSDRFTGEISHFLDCVRTGKTPSPSAEDGYRTARVIEAAYRSAALGRLVAVGR